MPSGVYKRKEEELERIRKLSLGKKMSDKLKKEMSDFKKTHNYKHSKYLKSKGKKVQVTIEGKQRYLHHLVYLKANPHLLEIPKGFVIHHINFDLEDNRIENLIMLSRSDHIKLHHGLDYIEYKRARELQQ